MIERCYAVVKKREIDGMIMMVMAVFHDRDEAQEWADNANQWYGKFHPLTPLTVVGDALFEPRKFPVEALREMS